jgi:hypothetical protein
MSRNIKILIGIIVLAGFTGLIAFMPSGDNPRYVELQGYVHDQTTGKPIARCKMAVFNCILQKDGSYKKDATLYTKTDADGHYEIDIENSYLLYIRAYKNGYAIARSGAVKAQPETEQHFILEKGNEPETDFYKEGESLDIIQ